MNLEDLAEAFECYRAAQSSYKLAETVLTAVLSMRTSAPARSKKSSVEMFMIVHAESCFHGSSVSERCVFPGDKNGT